jgi:hypothetical protein
MPAVTATDTVLKHVEQRVLWLAASIVHAAHTRRENISGGKVGGHQVPAELGRTHRGEHSTQLVVSSYDRLWGAAQARLAFLGTMTRYEDDLPGRVGLRPGRRGGGRPGISRARCPSIVEAALDLVD